MEGCYFTERFKNKNKKGKEIPYRRWSFDPLILFLTNGKKGKKCTCLYVVSRYDSTRFFIIIYSFGSGVKGDGRLSQTPITVGMEDGFHICVFSFFSLLKIIGGDVLAGYTSR